MTSPALRTVALGNAMKQHLYSDQVGDDSQFLDYQSLYLTTALQKLEENTGFSELLHELQQRKSRITVPECLYGWLNEDNTEAKRKYARNFLDLMIEIDVVTVWPPFYKQTHRRIEFPFNVCYDIASGYLQDRSSKN